MGKLKVRDVRAGNEQKERHGAHHDVQRRTNVADEQRVQALDVRSASGILGRELFRQPGSDCDRQSIQDRKPAISYGLLLERVIVTVTRGPASFVTRLKTGADKLSQVLED